MGRILVVDDDADMLSLLRSWLTGQRWTVACCASASEALALLDSAPPDVVLTDLTMRGMDGLELCGRIAANRPDVPVLLLTAHASLDAAVSAIRAGAYDFILKPVKVDALLLALERALRNRALREEVKHLRQRLADETPTFEGIIGRSPSMKLPLETVSRVAGLDSSVLITGETGTGKELVARALHDHGRRAAGPFVAINCAALPENLLEAELFGHSRGAFTGAHTARAGLFVEAHGGTLFLDELAEMPVGLQPKLLRALQERKVRPIGGGPEVAFDARLVSATSRDLEGAVADGAFRSDLYFRVNVVQIALPPLRARGADVLLIAQHLLDRLARRMDKKVTGLSPAAAERLLAYQWPGNVRELQNAIERAVALTRFEAIAVDDLPERIRDYRRSDVLVASSDPTELVSMEEVERRYISRVLEATGGNKTVAARILGLGRKTLYRKLERYGFEAGDGRAAVISVSPRSTSRS